MHTEQHDDMQTIETATNKSNNSDSNNKNTSNSISSSCDTASAPAKCLVNKKKARSKCSHGNAATALDKYVAN